MVFPWAFAHWLGVVALLLSSFVFFFSSRRRHTRSTRDWSSDVCSSDLSTWSARCPNRPRRDARRTGHRRAAGRRLVFPCGRPAFFVPTPAVSSSALTASDRKSVV